MERATAGGHIIIHTQTVEGIESKTLLIRLADATVLGGFQLPNMRHILHSATGETVIVSLLHQPLRQVFDSFLDTFTQAVQDTDTSHLLLDRLLEAFENFKRLVQLEPVLSADQCKGLYGEWLYIGHQLENGANPETTIESWYGPDRTAHDFVLPTHCCEVKSVARQSSQLRFSSENQLQALPDRSLQLMVNRIETLSQSDTDSMGEMYLEIIERLNHRGAIQQFRQKCESIGSGYYGPDSVTYSYRFHVIDSTFYTVDQETFPGLRTGNLPPGISHVSFRLDLSLLTEFTDDPL